MQLADAVGDGCLLTPHRREFDGSVREGTGVVHEDERRRKRRRFEKLGSHQFICDLATADITLATCYLGARLVTG